MNRAEFNYYKGNAEFASKYLSTIANEVISKDERNRAYNHCLAVECLLYVAERLFNENLRLIQRLGEADKVIKDLKSGEYKHLLEEEIQRHHRNFTTMKDSLIDFIKDFPDIDY